MTEERSFGRDSSGHRWSGWPGAWCFYCGCEDPREVALAVAGPLDDAEVERINSLVGPCQASAERKLAVDREMNPEAF